MIFTAGIEYERNEYWVRQRNCSLLNLICYFKIGRLEIFEFFVQNVHASVSTVQQPTKFSNFFLID